MASERPVYCDTFIANSDLSLCQYHAVKLVGNHTVDLCGDGEKPVGILQNKPHEGEWANVMLEGKSKVVIGEEVDAGDSWASNANGHLVKMAEGDWVGGQFVDGGALSATPTAGELTSTFVECKNPWYYYATRQ